MKSPWARAALALTLLAGPAGPVFAKDARDSKDSRNSRDSKDSRGSNDDRPGRHRKLDEALNRRADKGGTTRVIVTFKPGYAETDEVGKHGSKLGRRLRLINGRVVDMPNQVLRRIADHPAVESIHYDRPTARQMNRVAVTVGARSVWLDMGYTGAGVGVAVVDSGITSWHDDLINVSGSAAVRTKNNQRVVGFVDFINDRTSPYDDNGHGTHVAGTIAGNGYDSQFARAGIAPEAHLVGLKVLDENGTGVISDVIAALDWIVANKQLHNIRVANLSVGAAVTESYRTDPLTLAAKRAVDAGIVVVAAAGNLGRTADGRKQYGAITAPGNAPWVLTVGASSHQGTVDRSDDVMAPYSSRGPTAFDFDAKPDLVAPGTGLVSLADASSLFYRTKAQLLLAGSRSTAYRPYLSLSGTSMAAPVVSGSVALMLQANPSLTPNMVKAILQYTAQKYSGYDALTQGAGFLNTHGAVELARFYRTARSGSRLRIPRAWSRQIIWGTQRLIGGVPRPNANAWKSSTVWGSVRDSAGDNIVWGTIADGDNIVWGTFDALTNIVWGTLRDSSGDNIVWGTFAVGDNIVWGTAELADNIVWGTDCGGANCVNTVWGTFSVADNIVWGTAELADNIVWGTGGDVAGVVWATSSTEDGAAPAFDDPNGVPALEPPVSFEDLFPPELVTEEPPPPPSGTSSDGLLAPVSGLLPGITGGL